MSATWGERTDHRVRGFTGEGESVKGRVLGEYSCHGAHFEGEMFTYVVF